MVGGVEVGDVQVDVFNAVVACRAELYWKGDLSSLDALPGTTPKEESEGVRSVIPRPNSFRALAKRRFRALPPSTSTFSKKHFLDGCIEDEGKRPV